MPPLSYCCRTAPSLQDLRTVSPLHTSRARAGTLPAVPGPLCPATCSSCLRAPRHTSCFSAAAARGALRCVHCPRPPTTGPQDDTSCCRQGAGAPAVAVTAYHHMPPGLCNQPAALLTIHAPPCPSKQTRSHHGWLHEGRSAVYVPHPPSLLLPQVSTPLCEPPAVSFQPLVHSCKQGGGLLLLLGRAHHLRLCPVGAGAGGVGLLIRALLGGVHLRHNTHRQGPTAGVRTCAPGNTHGVWCMVYPCGQQQVLCALDVGDGS